MTCDWWVIEFSRGALWDDTRDGVGAGKGREGRERGMRQKRPKGMVGREENSSSSSLHDLLRLQHGHRTCQERVNIQEDQCHF